MSLNQYFEHIVIKGKSIYVVDDHHKALAAWALVRRSMAHAPNLITLDHHTDTHEAFLGHSHWEAYEGRTNDQESCRLGLVALIDWRDNQSVINAIANLKHDEHIDAATSSGTLDNAFCIQLSDSGATQSVEQVAFEMSMAESWQKPPSLAAPRRPMTYLPAESRVYAIPFDCFIGCKAKSHDAACYVKLSNEFIESKYLDDQLARGAEISTCIGIADPEAVPYILDIDLDAFHTRQAISPQDPSTFYRLVKNAVAVTIATEAECVEIEWLDADDQMSATDLLNELLVHLDNAI